MKGLIFIIVVCLFFIVGKEYFKSDASADELSEVNKVIEESKGKPYEADFKHKIDPLVKDGITVSEAHEILRIYEDVRINNHIDSNAKNKDKEEIQ